MHEIDLTEALSRLLADGSIRDLFATNPTRVASEFNIRESDRAAFVQLRPAELEIQADILLRKRLGRIRHMLPAACSTMPNLWLEFRRYARNTPANNQISDARRFCEFLAGENPALTKTREWHRLQFACSQKRITIRAINCSLQILVKSPTKLWHELNLSLESFAPSRLFATLR